MSENKNNTIIPYNIKNQTWRIVKIAKQNGEAFSFCGSGFFVPWNNKPYFVTNRHVITENGEDSHFYSIDSVKSFISSKKIIKK